MSEKFIKNEYSLASPKRKESLNKATKLWRSKNPEKIKEIRRKTDLKRSQQRRERLLLQKYGLSFNDYCSLLEEQGGMCKICGRIETRTHYKSKQIMLLHVDHCHTTGKVRGLLCSGCNLALGNLEDNIEYLENAILYLRKSRE